MSETLGTLTAEWLQTVPRDSRGFLYVPANEEAKAVLERSQQLSAILAKAVSNDGVYSSLNRIFGMTDYFNFAQRVQLKLFGLNRNEFVFREVVNSSFMLLMSSAVRYAKQHPDSPVTLTTDEWAETAFKDRDLGVAIEGYKLGHDWFEFCTGISNDEPLIQRQSINRIAQAIVSSEVLSTPEVLSWRGEVVRFQTATS